MITETPIDAANRGELLILSSSLLTDRMLLFSGALERLSQQAQVRVWATSAAGPAGGDAWVECPVPVEPFPEVRPYKEFPFNYLRRLNDAVWDERAPVASRVSMRRHVRDKRLRYDGRLINAAARMLGAFPVEATLERALARVLMTYPRSPVAAERLARRRPSAVFTMNPFWFTEPAVVVAARRAGVPVFAMVPSWDNITTKNRMVFEYDAYVVWSETMKQELLEHYPSARRVPVFVTGAPQFDVFHQERFVAPREEFFRQEGLDPALKLIVYALGSPNFLKDWHAAVELARCVDSGELGDVQLLVRPHPIHDRSELGRHFEPFSSRVRLQRTCDGDLPLLARTQDAGKVRSWVSTFHHADVVVNQASTATIDAAIFDRPSVSLNYDAEPGAPNQELVRDVHGSWPHFKRVAESGGVWLAGDMRGVLDAVGAYLRDPGLHAAERRRMALDVCGYLDGRCGERLGDALFDLVRLASRAGASVHGALGTGAHPPAGRVEAAER